MLQCCRLVSWRSPCLYCTQFNMVLSSVIYTTSSLEPSPEAYVERSLLRQCLENALAAELSPHERDVVRLRHGLDDGISRSVKEVVESCRGMVSEADIQRAEHRAYLKLRLPLSVHNRRLVDFASDFFPGSQLGTVLTNGISLKTDI